MSWFLGGLSKVWLPYDRGVGTPLVLRARSASGCKITLDDGRVLLDGTSSWWTMCHGYAHPYIMSRVRQQSDRLHHVMFSNFATEEAYILADRIAKLTKSSKILFAESGSSAVDAALKIALQCHCDDKRRTKFAYFTNGYHGETIAALSVTDVSWAPATLPVAGNYRFDIPGDVSGLAMLEQELSVVSDELVGVIVEPLLQCAGGMQFHSVDVLRGIYDITRRLGLIFIADEIAVGFYRVGGSMFACQRAGIVPDILLAGKALTGGYCGSGIVAIQDEIYQLFMSKNSMLMHGTTFMGNAVMSAAANASLDLFDSYDVAGAVSNIERVLLREMERFRSLDIVRDVRVMGAVGVVEFTQLDHSEAVAICHKVVDRGVWLRPFANVLYIMPPFIVTDEELLQIIDAAWHASLDLSEHRLSASQTKVA